MPKFDTSHDPAVSLSSARLLDHQGRALEADSRISGDVLDLRKKVPHTVATEVEYDIGRRLPLTTCLLPERTAPYPLVQELARDRIRRFFHKSEEWQMFDLSLDHPAHVEFEAARQDLVESLVASDPAESIRLGRDGLRKSVDACDQLTLAHAQILLHRRFGNHPASPSTFGVRYDGPVDSPGLRKLLGEQFGMLTIPIDWAVCEPKPGTFDFSSIEGKILWASEQGRPFMVGPLLAMRPGVLPEHVPLDFKSFRDRAYDFAEQVVARFGRYCPFWNIASGLNASHAPRLSPEETVDLARMLRLLVRQYRRDAKIMIEVREPWGEHASEYGLDPFDFVKRLGQNGVECDAIGVRMLAGGRHQGEAVRTLFDNACLLDRLLTIDKPVVATIGRAGGKDGLGQAKYASLTAQLCLSRRYVQSVVWSDLYDHPRSLVEHGGMVDAQGGARPVLAHWSKLRSKFSKPLGSVQLPKRGEGA